MQHLPSLKPNVSGFTVRTPLQWKSWGGCGQGKIINRQKFLKLKFPEELVPVVVDGCRWVVIAGGLRPAT